ncbi:MAG: hypothetical protein ACKO8I_04970, partial [Cyanobacteriota bacterium]
MLSSDGCGTGFSLFHSLPEPLISNPLARPWSIRAPVLRIGDPNFAHFLWNELDPLLHLLNRAKQRGERLEVVQDSDSILDLSSLEGVELLPQSVLEHRPSVHVGAMRVSAVARRTVLASLGAPPVAEANPAKPPILILGVRGEGRRELLNEETLLADVIRQLQTRWPTLRICLDGFTFQHNNYNDPACLARSEEIAARISRIQAACPGVDLETLHGLSFESYLSRVAEASFYITHEGTVHHKIGWMYPEIPGLILVAGPHGVAVGHWHRDQCEGAHLVMVLPTGLLQHAKDRLPGRSDGSGTEEQQRDQPFECCDPVAMIDAIKRLLAPHLDPLTATQVVSSEPPATTSPFVVLEVRGEGPGGLEREEEIWAGLVQQLRHRWPELQLALLSGGADANLQAQGSRIVARFPEGVTSLIGLPNEERMGRLARASMAITYPGELAEWLASAVPRLPVLQLTAGAAGGNGCREEEVTRLPEGLLTPCLQEGGASWRVAEELPFRDAIEHLVAPNMASGNSSTLFDCVWTAEDPHAALLAHGERCRAAARNDRAALGELAEVAWATREPELLTEAWEALEGWPHADGWLRVARLRLRLARRDPPEVCRAEAEALLPEVEGLDEQARLLLASVLEQPVRGLEARVLGPAGLGSEPSRTESISRLLGEKGGLSLTEEERERVAIGLAAAAHSLRRPYRNWADPEAAREGSLDPLLGRITSALKARTGFSLIRLGDGEGSFLCGKRPDLGGATSNGLRLDPAISQRGGALEEGAHQALIERFVAAVGRADAIGVPDLDQCLNGPEESWRVPAGLALRFDAAGL